MHIYLTENEFKQYEALCTRYEALIAEAKTDADRLAPIDYPDTDSFFKGLDAKKNPEEWKAAILKEHAALDEWFAKGSQEWKEAQRKHSRLLDEFADAKTGFTAQCENRQFNELGGDPDKIRADFETQVYLIIDDIYKGEKAFEEHAASMGGGDISSAYMIPLGGSRWKLDPEQVQGRLKRELHLHYEAFRGDQETITAFDNYIIDSMLKSPYIAQPGTKAKAKKVKVKGTDTGLSISGKRVKKVDFPHDKINNNVWNSLAEADTAGQYNFTFNFANLSDKRKDKQILVYYSLNFDAITDATTTKKLLPYDQRVYLAVAALYNRGNSIITNSEIYKAMGNSNRPSKKDIDKIKQSVTKMAMAWLSIDNSEEIKAGYKYEAFGYDSNLLAIERLHGTFYINGAAVKDPIHVFREPPLVTFARQRKQLTTFDISVLDTPVYKTDENIMIENYFLDAITAIKGKRRNSKVLFSTLYKAADIKGKQIQRAPGKIIKILDHYIKCGLIAGYIMEKDGIEINVSSEQKAISD